MCIRDSANTPKTPAAVRYALGAIKNVGSEAMSRLVDVRQNGGPFCSLEDLLRRLPREVINRRQMEGLVRAGAFDSIHSNRRELLENIELLLSHADAMRREAESNQDNLFGGTNETDVDSIRLRPQTDWATMDRLKEEFDALGLYLSAHPLDCYASQLSRLRILSHATLAELLEAGLAPQPVSYTHLTLPTN